MIPVEWVNLHPDVCSPRDHWDTSWLQAVFTGRIGGDDEPVDPDDWYSNIGLGRVGVAMIAGNFHRGDVAAINSRLHDDYSGVVVVVHSDEESLFPVNELSHPDMRLWVMTPRPDRTYPPGTRFLGEGWSPYTPEILSAWRHNGDDERPVDVGFQGQVTHRRRTEMVAAWGNPNGTQGVKADGTWVNILPTSGFTAGLPRAVYLRGLQQTKVALCPSGPATQDSFRVFEALEAGCVPLVDAVTPDGRTGYWDLLLDGPTPFPTIHDWREGPHIARTVLDNFEAWQTQCREWWAGYQQRLVDQLRADVRAVRG